jgi:hypothetical protein
LVEPDKGGGRYILQERYRIHSTLISEDEVKYADKELKKIGKVFYDIL